MTAPKEPADHQQEDTFAQDVPVEAVQPDVTTPEEARDEAPIDELAALHAQVATLQSELAEQREAVLRARADADNVRRRAQDDVAKAHKFGIESFAEALVPVKDSLEQALAQSEQTLETLREGVEITLKQLNAAFERGRLREVAPAQGDKFDPHQHQAISSIPADQPANTVITTLQKGYLISDRVLRPALVTVAAG